MVTIGRRSAWVLAGALLMLVLVLVLVLVEVARWPDVAALRSTDPESTAYLDDYREWAKRNGKPQPQWRRVKYDQIAPSLKRAVLVAEDINFFSHHGFATDEIKAAVRESWTEGKPLRGASTLTQQLAKNLWLSPSRTPWRKLKEALLVVELERTLEKRRILELYLNVVELGPGIYGAEAAARHYYGISAAELSEDQAAALAAALPRPKAWHPGSQHRGYSSHVERIRQRMARATWLESMV